jgi:hypothetical protein
MLKFIMITVLMLCLAACSSGARTNSMNEASLQNAESYGRSLSVVTLNDGTKCAIYSSGYKGGIHCNW